MVKRPTVDFGSGHDLTNIYIFVVHGDVANILSVAWGLGLTFLL